MTEEKSHRAGGQVAGLSSSLGGSAQPHYTTNGASGVPSSFDASSDILDVETMLAGSFHSAEQLSTEASILQAITHLIGLAAGAGEFGERLLSQQAQQFTAYLDTADRDALRQPLRAWLKAEDAVEAWLAACPPAPSAPVFKPLNLSELLAMPPKTWLIDQVIGERDLAMIFGPPGSGKTFVVIDLIFAACLGQQFARRFEVFKPLKVAYCAGEGLGGLPARFAAAAHLYAVGELPSFEFYQTVPQLYSEPGSGSQIEGPDIRRFVAEWQARQAAGASSGLDLLIVDTLHSAISGAEENSSKDMGQVLRLLKWASRELGCAVLLVHHSNKAGTGERGSSAIRGALDTLLEVKPVAGKFALHAEKVKDGQAWKDQTFSLTAVGDTESVRVWWDEPGDLPVTSGRQSAAMLAELQKRPGVRFTAKQLAEAVGATLSATNNVLARLVEKQQAQRVLYDESKEPSNRNPWVYFVAVEVQASTEV